MVYLEEPTGFEARFSVVSCIFVWKHQTLILQRNYAKTEGGKWGFPGGKIETGEGVEQAMRREIHEETGIVLEEKSLHLYRLFYVDTLGTHFLYYLYYIEFEKKPDIIISDEHLGYKWIDLVDVLSERIVADHPFCMKLFLKEKQFE